VDKTTALRYAQELQLQESARLSPVLFHGKSMLPFIQEDDELWAESVAWEDIQPGDIITYRLADRFPTCRVMTKRGEHLLLSADHWRWARFEAWREDVLGRVIARRRNGETLRYTDAEWVRHTKLALLNFRARNVVHLARSRWERVQYRARERWISLQDGYSELPHNIQVNLSAQCNLRCRMCPYLEIHRDPKRQRYMPVETYAKLLPALKHINAVALVGAGEPLFHKDLVRIMEMTREASPTAQIDITTNGTLLTRQVAAELIRLRVHKVHISFDGLNEETVKAIRRGINYSRVLQNIRTLNESKKDQDAFHPIIQINFMLGYGTYRELLDFIPLAQELGVREIQLLEMQPATAEDYADNMYNNLVRDHGQLLRQVLKTASHAGIHIALPAVIKNACRHPYTPHIGEDGEVYPCCYLDYDGRQLYYQGQEIKTEAVSFGNVNRTPFREIWNSPAYVELRHNLKAGKFSGYCHTCYKIREESADKVIQVLGPR
jgi:MoaA/NifB/PqqE/SkfB family radical SAM enzyme